MTAFHTQRLAYWHQNPAYSVQDLIPQILKFLQLATHWNASLTSEKLFLSISNSLSAYITIDGDRIVGFGQIIGDGHLQANLKNIASHPSYRGQRIATNIVKALILDVSNCDVIRAETSQAKVLYERLGFTEYSGDVMELIR